LRLGEGFAVRESGALRAFALTTHCSGGVGQPPRVTNVSFLRGAGQGPREVVGREVDPLHRGSVGRTGTGNLRSQDNPIAGKCTPFWFSPCPISRATVTRDPPPGGGGPGKRRSFNYGLVFGGICPQLKESGKLEETRKLADLSQIFPSETLQWMLPQTTSGVCIFRLLLPVQFSL